MSVLGIDTSTRACGVAIVSEGRLLGSAAIDLPRAHAERLLPLIHACIAGAGDEGAGIGAVAVASGPGSFTGLRIGFSSAKGICLGRSASLVAVPTFDAWAWSAAKECALPAGSRILAVMGAGREDAYAGSYRVSKEGATAEGAPGVYPFVELGRLAAREPARGTSAGRGTVPDPGGVLIIADDPARAAAWFPGVPPASIRAADGGGNPAVAVAMLGERMFRSGATADLRSAEPAYLRNFSYTLKNGQGA